MAQIDVESAFQTVSRLCVLVSSIRNAHLSGVALAGGGEEVTKRILDHVVLLGEIVADATQEVVSKLVAEAPTPWTCPSVVIRGEQ